ncbi:hypothetical protein C9J03_11425 [Photobacterium gaetbulicola]|uniref:Putative Glutamate mutase subunit E n=1 Tax=Photobacterium gaetbulicola Gung47 TaxID=658445 RepID=A0A0C5WS78_9GAMM|nr:hypothetical protein [Photobacterium gaetbulicola]AJR09207.1 putative Glutamate mutase subunit E [Photobacterium gaetbulicola Gung47]PSU11742.1 hypothetical protein C9J03_11425 [Photobacterium gaetbulicola]
MPNCKVLLAGIGKDSHSVGLHLLKLSLAERGFDVDFRGIQNNPEDFKSLSKDYQLVMLSTLDGHASLYLQNFTISEHDKQGALWVIGGNLTIDAEPGALEAAFQTKGFDLVYPKYVDLTTFFLQLEQLFTLNNIALPLPDTKHAQTGIHQHLLSRIDELEAGSSFMRSRAKVLASHPNGQAAANLHQNGLFLAEKPSFSHIVSHSRSLCHLPLLQPRSGVSTTSEQLRYFEHFTSLGVEVLSFQIDSLTRNNDYNGAEQGLNQNKLNGFPLINHGVGPVRAICQAVAPPLQVRHSTKDPRLLAEISLAAGCTSFEGGPICYNIPYYKDYSLAESLNRWAYVDQLCAHYYQYHGVAIDREFFGTLTGTLIPPSLAIASNILEMLTAISHGVKSVSLGYAEQGCRSQDIAAIAVMGELAKQTAAAHGFNDITIQTVFHQYMAAFPATRARSEQLIYASAQTAVLAGADRLLYKTAAEFNNIPTLEDNTEAFQLIQRAMRDTATADWEMVNIEKEIIYQETTELLSTILGHQADYRDAIINAFNRGWLDIPFSPSLYSMGRVTTARDNSYAVRYLDCGNLPLSAASKKRNSDMVEAKKEKLNISSNADLLEHDLLLIPRGQYRHWPLS